MPLYEYECTDCHHSFEELRSSSATDTPSCPSCNSDKTKKKVSAGAIRGSGGYAMGGNSSIASPSCSTGG